MAIDNKAFWAEQYATHPGAGTPAPRPAQAKNAERVAARNAKAAGIRANQRHPGQSGFAGVEPGGGFSTPPSMPGIQMDGGTPQALPRPLSGPYPAKTSTPYPDVGTTSPVQGRPALPRPMPGQAAPAPGGLPSNLPVPPGGGGGWGPGKAGTPGQTGAPVQASPFAGVRPMGVGADPYSTGSTARPVGSGWKNPGQGMAPLPKRPPVTLGGPARTIQSSQGPGSSSTRTQY